MCKDCKVCLWSHIFFLLQRLCRQSIRKRIPTIEEVYDLPLPQVNGVDQCPQKGKGPPGCSLIAIESTLLKVHSYSIRNIGISFSQGLKEFLHFNFLRDDFKLLVKSAPRLKEVRHMLPRTRNVAADLPHEFIVDEADPYVLEAGKQERRDSWGGSVAVE